jgi:DNA-binding MarR family transcriptional regulator
MPDAPPPNELMIALIDEIIRGQTRIALVYDLAGGLQDLNKTGRSVLTAVVRATTPPTVPQIGRSLGYPRQTIQRHAEELVGLGFVEFVDNPDHKRAKRLVATHAGAAWYAEAHRRALDWAAKFTCGLDPEDLATAVGVLRQVRQRLERQARSKADFTSLSKAS